MAVLIEAKQDDPIKDGTGPFDLRQKGFGVNSIVSVEAAVPAAIIGSCRRHACHYR